MDELSEMMGAVSDTEGASPWDPGSALAGQESTGSCTVMDPFIAIGALKKGTSEEGLGGFPDSDDSEVNRRRQRHKSIPDPLKKLLKNEMPGLLGFLKRDLPRSAHFPKRGSIAHIKDLGAHSGWCTWNKIILAFIQTIQRWKESFEMKRSGIKYKILVSRDECGSEYPLIIAFYVLGGEVKGSIYAPFYSGIQTLKEAFKYSTHWSLDGAEGSCEWSVYPAEAAEEFLSLKHGSRYASYPIHMYWISPEDLRLSGIEVPREFKIAPLNVVHVNTVNQYWGRRHEGSADWVQQMINNNPTIGAFTFDDEMASWALQTHYGALDIVYTVHKHRKKGTARSLLVSLARTLDSDGCPAHAFAHRDDHGTKTFLAKSGFTFVSEYFYFYTDPPLKPDASFKKNNYSRFDHPDQ